MSDSPKTDFIREIIAADLSSGKHEGSITRFPPEPNGFLHLGHAKSICLNFGIAGEFPNSKCNLRFDDTNPDKEETQYVESIKEDVKWLGFDYGENIFFASDYFEFFHDCAVHLIKSGLAYVDEESPEEIKLHRGNIQNPGMPSRFRERSVDENLEKFAAMRGGKFQEGQAVLRAKIGLTSSNMNMRDPVLYRILHSHHHNTGSAWCIYPMYDFAHPLEDAFEHVTHSLCTLEFENHRPLYDWVMGNCLVPSQPRQIEFARLSLTYTVLSKRKLLQLVLENHVTGWDDPRLPTISGIRRRGYPPEAIRHFCKRIGITKYNGTTDVALLEHDIRDSLNATAPRRMAVLDPLKVVIENFADEPTASLVIANHPQDAAFGERAVAFSPEVLIEREDFQEIPEKKYFRLAPEKFVRLRGGPIIQCTGFEKNTAGEIILVRANLLPGTTGKDTPEGVICKAAIHWVDATSAVNAEVRLYDRLFTTENPDAAEGGFLSVLNPDSVTTIHAKVEASLALEAPGFSCQFERNGYFITDSKDHQPGEKIVFNRTVPLRDSWGKGH